MAKSLAWGYGIAGAVVATAVIVIAGSTVGLTADADDGASVPTFNTQSVPVPLGGDVVSSEVVTTATGEQVEYVYVDQPADTDARHHDDDDDDRHREDRDDDRREPHDDEDDD